MSAGKAKGKDRDYQVFVRDILCLVNPQLTPYQDDGIDIVLKIDDVNATISFDILLEDSQGNLFAGECKRWKSPIKQNEIFAFQKKIEELRKITEKEISRLFFVKHAFQLGAIKIADYYGVRVVTCSEKQPLDGFSLANCIMILFKIRNFKKVKLTF